MLLLSGRQAFLLLLLLLVGVHCRDADDNSETMASKPIGVRHALRAGLAWVTELEAGLELRAAAELRAAELRAGARMLNGVCVLG